MILDFTVEHFKLFFIGSYKIRQRPHFVLQPVYLTLKSVLNFHVFRQRFLQLPDFFFLFFRVVLLFIGSFEFAQPLFEFVDSELLSNKALIE